MTKRDWEPILAAAAAFVDGLNADGTGVTLRQTFYRLVSDGLIHNTVSDYSQLTKKTAEARRRGDFPAFIDRGREIHRDQTFADPDDARDWLADIYRRDRTEGQETSVYVGVEKNGMV